MKNKKGKVFTHTGRLIRVYEYSLRPTGETKLVNLRQTKLFWFDQWGRRFKKDYGRSAGCSWVLDLDTIEEKRS